MRRAIALALTLPVLLAAAACGGKSDSAGNSTHTPSGTIAGLSVTGAFGSQPTVKISKPIKATKAETAVITAGSGTTVKTGDAVSLNYYLADAGTGKKLESTYDASTGPTTLTMSASSANSVLLKALLGRKQGSRIALVDMVSDLFGSQGVGTLKPTDSAVVVFDVMSVSTPLTAPKGASVTEPSGLPTVVQAAGQVTGLSWAHTAKKAPTKLRVVPLIAGTGATVKAGDSVTVNYYGAVWGSDKAFDSSFARKQTATFQIGTGAVIQAWDKEIPGLKLGSRVLIVAPPSAAYGNKANGNIPANSTLVFVVDILGITPGS
ncbi:MAG: FKBP-type peptidyl-prolyl cis-trans isomerase [Nocardioidaceae bacterium]